MPKANGQNYECPICGKTFYRTPGQLKKTTVPYCSRECFKTVSSPRMTAINIAENPTRMTGATKEKIRVSRLKPPDERKSYTKIHGIHTHRIVAEQILRRPLNSGEVVHHIDRDIQNNNPENIMIFKTQADHAKWHKENDKGGDAK